jgi:hypothetical protein
LFLSDTKQKTFHLTSSLPLIPLAAAAASFRHGGVHSPSSPHTISTTLPSRLSSLVVVFITKIYLMNR